MLKRISLLHLFLCQEPVDYTCVSLFLASPFCSTSLFFHQYQFIHSHWLDHVAVQEVLKLGSAGALILFFSSVILAILGLLLLHANLRISLSESIKQLAGILIEIALYVSIKLGRADIFTILHPSMYEHDIHLHGFSSLSSEMKTDFIPQFYTFCHIDLEHILLDLY